MTLPNFPQQPQPPVPPGLQALRAQQAWVEERRRRMERIRARQAVGAIEPTQRTEIDPTTLQPSLTEQPGGEPDRHSFFGRLQSFADTVGGTWTGALSSIIPGKQAAFNEEELARNYRDVQGELPEGTNPWQMLRREMMATAEAYRRTDMPTKRFDIIPGKGINLPGERTLNEIDLGVKGAVEVIGDPLNFIPYGVVARTGLKASAMGLRKGGMGVVAEAAESGARAASDALASTKQLLPTNWKKDLRPEVKPGTRFFRGEVAAGKGAQSRMPKSSTAPMYFGSATYLTASAKEAAMYSRKQQGGVVREFRVDWGELAAISGEADGTKYLKEVMNNKKALAKGESAVDLNPYILDFDMPIEEAVSRHPALLAVGDHYGLNPLTDPRMEKYGEKAGIGRWFGDVQKEVVQRLPDDPNLSPLDIAERLALEREDLARAFYDPNIIGDAVPIKAFGVSGAPRIGGYLAVLDRKALQEVAPPLGIRTKGQRWIRPKTHENLQETLNEALEKLPKWVKRLKESDKRVLGPLGWVLGRMNPMAMLKAGTAVTHKIKHATTIHQLQHVDAGSQVEFSLRSLGMLGTRANPEGKALFSQKSEGFGWIQESIDGVFDVTEGRITNLVNPDGTLADFTKHKYGDTAALQYAVFEGAFEGGRGYTFANKYAVPRAISLETGRPVYRTIAEHLALDIDRNARLVRAGLPPVGAVDYLIAKGKVSPQFVEQVEAITHVQKWYDEGREMMRGYGVEVKEVFEGKSALAYIHKLAVSVNKRPLPVRQKTSGAKQPISKARTYTDEKFIEGVQRHGLKYEDHFLLSSREFSDSVYQSIRDTEIRNALGSLGSKVFDEFLPPFRRTLEKHEKTVKGLRRMLSSVGKIVKGGQIHGPTTTKMREFGQDYGWDWDNATATDVRERAEKALQYASDLADGNLKEAREIEKIIRTGTKATAPKLFKDVTRRLVRKPHSQAGEIHYAGEYSSVPKGKATEAGEQLTFPKEVPSTLKVHPAASLRGDKLTEKAFPHGEYPAWLHHEGRFPELTAALRKIHLAEERLRRTKKSKTTYRTVDGVRQKQIVTDTSRIDAETQHAALKTAIKNDVDQLKKDATRAKSIVGESKKRKHHSVPKKDARFLEVNYPKVLKELEAAGADITKARAIRMAAIIKTMEKELADELILVTESRRNLKNEIAKFAHGFHIKAGSYDEITGKHKLAPLFGEEQRLFEGDTLILTQASQKRLPFLSGMFFTEKDVRVIERSLLLPETETTAGRVQAFFLRDAPALGDFARLMKAGFDFGAPFLQGIPVLARRPDVWVKATIHHMRVAARGGGVHTRYLQQNMDALREMIEMGVPFSGAASDYFVALQRGGVLPKIGEALEGGVLRNSDRLAAKGARKAGRVFSDVAGRFENSFESFGDYARLEMWKALRNTAAKEGPDGLTELAAFIRNSTGALNAGSLGATPTQQALERGWLFFSPRYTRASLALISDAFQGGLRGQEARQTFAQLLAGGAAVYAGIATALQQPIRLDPRPKSEGGDGAEFMTINISGSHVGIGSFWTSFIRLLGGMGTTAVDDPTRFTSPSTRDNPIMRWMRSRSAPSTGFLSDIANGANFLGEPLESYGDWTSHVTRQVLPFTIENAIYDDGPIFGRLTANVPAEFVGMRTFPVSTIEQRNYERELAARERFNKGWDELNGLQKDEVENDPNRPLGELSRTVRAEAGRLRPADPRTADGMIDAWFADKEDAELLWRAEVKTGVQLFAQSSIDAVVFKERYLQPANAARRQRIGDLAEDESFREVERFFAELGKNDVLLPEEEMFKEYIDEIVASNEWEDPVIGFDFRAKDAAERLFADKWGQESLAYCRERFRAARESYDFAFPALIDELYIGRERFEWYWRGTEEEVLALSPNPDLLLSDYEMYLKLTPTDRKAMVENNKRLKSFLATMSKARQLLREQNAELDIFMYRWGFTDTLRHEDNQWEDDSGGAKKEWRTAPAMTFPYPVRKS